MKSNLFNFRHGPRKSLTLLLLVLIGVVGFSQSTWAATKLTGKIYFDNSVNNWTGTIYCYVGHSGYTKVYYMSDSNGDGIWETNTTFSNGWGDQTNVFFSQNLYGSWADTNGSDKGISTVSGSLSKKTGMSTEITSGVNTASTPYIPASSEDGAALATHEYVPCANCKTITKK